MVDVQHLRLHFHLLFPIVRLFISALHIDFNYPLQLDPWIWAAYGRMTKLDFLVIIQFSTQQFVQLFQIFRTTKLPLIAEDALKLLPVNQAMKEGF